MGKTITAVILAGGKGERLRPLTDTLPKPMVKIANKPLLEYVVRHLRRYDIKEIILSVGYLPEVIKKHFGNGKKFGVHISYIIENIPLGTAGAVRLLKNKIKDTFLVCYGDILRDINLKDLVKFHQNRKGIAVICVYKNTKPNPKSIITFDKDKKISRFIERPSNQSKKWVWSNASLYLFEPEIFAYIAKNTRVDFGKNVIPKVIADGKRVYAF
ncbi:nucleotidyltransferase family protein, partial [Candidatus Gottesmanbacteria bacterium]|nr:nucleotidyltransferase family protein [Candidatus Gottesmanbacteria bacterium]